MNFSSRHNIKTATKLTFEVVNDRLSNMKSCLVQRTVAQLHKQCNAYFAKVTTTEPNVLPPFLWNTKIKATQAKFSIQRGHLHVVGHKLRKYSNWYHSKLLRQCHNAETKHVLMQNSTRPQPITGSTHMSWHWLDKWSYPYYLPKILKHN